MDDSLVFSAHQVRVEFPLLPNPFPDLNRRYFHKGKIWQQTEINQIFAREMDQQQRFYLVQKRMSFAYCQCLFAFLARKQESRHSRLNRGALRLTREIL